MTNIVCEGGVCRMVVDAASAAAAPLTNVVSAAVEPSVRVAQGLMDESSFLDFLAGTAAATPFDGATPALALLAAVGIGFALNLTPCVLPMVPVNLMIVGRSFRRGLLYGLGIALAYGVLGAAAAFGGVSFGTLQARPVFNFAVAALFAALSLALLGVWNAGVRAAPPAWLRALKGAWFPLLWGAVGALLAGACVAPMLVAVLTLAADLAARGEAWAWCLPFAVGIGMALPWPFLGAGVGLLPKPGGWMRWVNRLFAAVVLAFAVRYAALGWSGLSADAAPSSSDVETVPSAFAARLAATRAAAPDRPVLVDCWASWCRNCAEMDRILARPAVREVLKGYSVLRLRAEDMRELKDLPGFGEVRGLPAFVIFAPDPQSNR